MDEVRPKVVSRSSLIEFPGHRTGKLVEPGGFPKLKRWSWEFRETNTERVTKANWWGGGGGGKRAMRRENCRDPEGSLTYYSGERCSENTGEEATLRNHLGKEPPARITKNSAVLTQDHLCFFCLWYLCCCSIAKSCPTLFDPLNSSSPGFPVLHYLLEFA